MSRRERSHPEGHVAISDHALRRDGQALSLRSGEAHYWRLDRDAWEPVLDSLVELGASAVTVYIPWEAHEIEPGRFDFGEIDPRLDLEAFLTLAEDRGLDIVARPGPQINGEMTWFGYPRRLLEREDLHMRSAAGSRTVLTQVPKPIPAISYANDAFFEEVASWYDACCAVLARHAPPHGRLVAVQVDNEMAFFFNVNAWAADYSDASLRGYRSFLQEKYHDLETLNGVYGTATRAWEDLDPPRRFDARSARDIPFHADWSEYRERYLVSAVGRLAQMMRERGLDGVPLFHNYPHPLNPGAASSGVTTPFHLMALEREIDFVGWDIYSRRELYSHVKTVVSYVAGSSRYPYAPELIGGSWPWYQQPGDAGDEEFVIRAALMHGLKGYSRYMMVDRDRWLGSPVRRDGSLRAPGAEVARRANRLVADHDLAAYRRRADVLLLADRDYDRLAASSVLVSFPGDFLESPTGFSEYPNDLTLSEATLGLAQPVAIEKGRRFDAYLTALTEAHFRFLLSDTEIDPAHWSQYRAVVLTSFEYLNARVQRTIVDYAGAGGTVVLGPWLPDRDERLAPDTTLRDALDGPGPGRHPIGEGQVVVLEQAPDAAALSDALSPLDLPTPTAGPGLDVVVHDHPHDHGRLIVFVANPGETEIDARLELGAPIARATELWEGRTVPAADGVVQDRRPGYSIGVYDCTLDTSSQTRS